MRRLLDPWRETSGRWRVLAFAVVYALVAGPVSWVVSPVSGYMAHPEGALVVVGSLLVGPVAAWGSAIGTAATDLLAGGVSLETVCRVPATGLGSVVAYRLWDSLGPSRSAPRSRRRAVAREFGRYVVVAVAATATLVATEGWLLEVFSLSSFSVVVPGRFVDLASLAVVAFPGWLALRGRTGSVEWAGSDQDPTAERSLGRRRSAALVAVPVAWVLAGSLTSYVFRAIGSVTPQLVEARLGRWATAILELGGPRGGWLLVLGGVVAVVVVLWGLWDGDHRTSH